MGWAIWVVVLFMAARLERFWPRGLYLIAGTSLALMALGLGASANDILSGGADIWSASILAQSLAITVGTTSTLVGIGYAVGKFHRWRANRKAIRKLAE